MSFELTILGISSATPTLNRHPSAQFLSFGNQSILLDCGEGTQMQLLKYGLKSFRISKIFISHLHPDHFLGLPGLLGTYSLKGRQQSLDIYAPEGLQEIIEVQFRLGEVYLSYPIYFHALPQQDERLIYEDQYMTVHAYQLQHRMSCWGFVLREKKAPRSILKDRVQGQSMSPEAFHHLRQGEDYLDESGKFFPASEYTVPNSPPDSYAYITDTLFLPGLAEKLRGIRVLYHEATFLEDKKEKAAQTHHSTAHEAAEFARISQAEKLIIGHFSSRYSDLQPLLSEAKEIFHNTELAEEGKKYLF